jgi:hypothetical protein
MQNVEYLLLHGIQLILHCVHHMGAGIVMQQDDANSEFTVSTHIHTRLECLTLTASTDCIIT